MKKSDKKNFKDKKEKKAYIAQEDNGMDSSSDSKNEIINRGLVAKDYESGEKVAPSNYVLSISFDEL